MRVGRGLYLCIIFLYVAGRFKIISLNDNSNIGERNVVKYLSTIFSIEARARYCSARCARTLEPVCALVAVGEARDLRVYHNICHLYKIQCLLEKHFFVKVVQLPESFCGTSSGTAKSKDSRRYIDNTIVGSRNFCNHTCPTHCTDIYDPVCAQIWDQNNVLKRSHVLINHCHADLVSCSLQQTVQVQTLDYCLGSMTQFAYAALAQAAVLKKLGLINV